MSFLTTIFSVVQGFFEFLFASSSPEYRKKQELKQILRRVKQIQPPLYRNGGYLLPAFATALYQLQQFLQPVKKTLSASIANQDKRVSEKCRDFILETALTPEEKKLRLSLSYTNRNAELKGNTDVSKLLENQGKQFNQYLKLLESEPFKNSAEILEKLDALKDLCDFNFQGIFIVFDPAFQSDFELLPGDENSDSKKSGNTEEKNTRHQSNFQAIPVSELIPQLLDLNFLLQNIDLSQRISEALVLLSAFILNTQVTEEMHLQINRILQMVSWQIKNKISSSFILDIIKLEKNDPAFIPENPERKIDVLQLYKTRITEIFHNDSKKIMQNAQENETIELIRKIFGNIPLETISGYNDENNQIISENTPFSFEWVLPLRVIKTFTQKFLEQYFKQILNAVIVEGFFANRVLQSTFASHFFFCNGISQKIQEFENLFQNEQPFSIPVMHSYVAGIKNGEDFEKPLRNMVENANIQAKNLIQQCAVNYSGLFNFADTVLEENKKPVPDIITNIKTLTSSTKNAESYRLLESNIQIFKNFLDLMKKYAIIPENLVKS